MPGVKEGSKGMCVTGWVVPHKFDNTGCTSFSCSCLHKLAWMGPETRRAAEPARSSCREPNVAPEKTLDEEWHPPRGGFRAGTKSIDLTAGTDHGRFVVVSRVAR